MRKQIAFCIAGDIRRESNDADITAKLQAFARGCTPDSLFVSFVVMFQHTPRLSELAFEHYLWERLQSIHNHDALDYDWDSQVSSNPESPHFSMSVGGKGFYVIGLHPNASRPARRFDVPAMVFNLHSQFELLREEGSYARIRDTILQRDEKLSGNLNPMLAQHGQSSEARQYSGRVLENNWKCPFHARAKAGA